MLAAGYRGFAIIPFNVSSEAKIKLELSTLSGQSKVSTLLKSICKSTSSSVYTKRLKFCQ
jgi:hypothetical protein